jgi:hypothetical protein
VAKTGKWRIAKAAEVGEAAGPANAGLPFPDFTFLKSGKSSDILALGCLEKSGMST